MSGFELLRRFTVRKMTEIQQLIAAYARTGSEQAFRDLVTRYVNLVYSTALRLVGGDTHLAEDITQTVFLHLAKKVHNLSADVRLGGWLHRATCNVAMTVIRGERRRQLRERQLVEMNTQQDHTTENLDRLTPILDDAIEKLSAEDRTAIVLRFFEQLDFRGVGETLGSTEEAARKRVNRALAKLQLLLKHRGVVSSATALGTLLAAEAVSAAPVALAASVAGAALAGAASGSSGPVILFKLLTMTKLKLGIIGSVVVVGMGAFVVREHRDNLRLRNQLASVTVARTTPRTPGRTARTEAVQRFDWRQVESTEYTTYIANLRAIGCPEQTIKDIIIADVNALFEAKEKQNLVLTNRIEFWKTGMNVKDWVKDQLVHRYEQLESERAAIIKNLLGETTVVESRPAKISDADIQYNLLDFLAPQDRQTAMAAISEVNSTFATKFQPLLASDRWNTESRKNYGEFCHDEEQRLLDALGTEGKENYDVRASKLADYLRWRFRGIDFSEGEFRELYRFSHPNALDLDLWYVDPSIEEESKANQAAQLAVWNKAKEIVGDLRFEARTLDKTLSAYGVIK